jgi:hypothetical protein
MFAKLMRQGSTQMRRVGIALVVVCLGCLGSGPALGQEKTKPLPAEIVAAWQKAGAEVGWMGPTQFGLLDFRPGDGGKVGEVATFRIVPWQPGVLGGLPQPEQPLD